MPNKGDKVRVEVVGEYSHRGAVGAGWHSVKVGSNVVALPPDTEFTVTEPWRRQEPTNSDVLVRNSRSGKVYLKCWSGCCYVEQNVPDPDMLIWRQLLGDSNDGRDLVIYNEA